MHADADAIWNRACDLMAGEHLPDARRGDHALADALALDSTIQGNGVAQALERKLVSDADAFMPL